MTIKRLSLGILVVAALSAAGYWAYGQFLRPEEESTGTSDVNDLSVDTGVDQVSAEGQVIPLADQTLSFSTGGQLVEIAVVEGDNVQIGDPLLRLDDTDQQIALRQAEANLTQARANQETAAAGLMAAQAGLEAVQADVVAAEAQLALLLAGPTEAQIAVSESSVDVAQASVGQAVGNQALVLQAANSAEIAAAEAALAAAETAYTTAIRIYQPVLQSEEAPDADKVQAQLQLNAALASFNAAQSTLAELQVGATEPERLAAAGAVQAAVNQNQMAQAELALLLTGTREEQIAIAGSDVMIANNQVVEAELQIELAAAAVSQAEAAVMEAEAAVAAAQSALEKRTLLSPIDGTVADVAVDEGEVISPGMPVVTLANFAGWQIATTDMNELDIVAIAQGFEAEITIDAFAGERFRGTVTDIATVSMAVRGDVTYEVTIALEDDQGLPLRWGMTAFVTIPTDQ